jgi:hypothetical protein
MLIEVQPNLLFDYKLSKKAAHHQLVVMKAPALNIPNQSESTI